MVYSSKRYEETVKYLNKKSIIEIATLFGSEVEGGKGSCIFHDEGKPSMFLTEDIDDNGESCGVFHCFSCGAGGRVHNMIQQYYWVYQHKRKEEALEQFLIDHRELCKDAPYQTLKVSGFDNKKEIKVVDLDSVNNLKILKPTFIDIKVKPKASELKDIEEILDYVISVQNEGMIL